MSPTANINSYTKHQVQIFNELKHFGLTLSQHLKSNMMDGVVALSPALLLCSGRGAVIDVSPLS